MAHTLEEINQQITAHNVALHLLEEGKRAIQKRDAWAANYYNELQEINNEDISAYFERNQDSLYL